MEVTIGLGFTSDWLRKWLKVFNQSQSVVEQKQTQIMFKTQLKSNPL